MAAIDGKVVHINQHEAWYFHRPSTHTLSVVDQKNREVLWVSSENPRYLSVRAKFFGANDSSLNSNENTTVDDHGNSMSDNCSSEHVVPGTELTKAMFVASLGRPLGYVPVMGMR